MITVRRATHPDVNYIRANASKAFMADIEAFQITDDRIANILDDSPDKFAFTILVDDIPVLAFGSNPDLDDPSRWYSWMFYTDLFYLYHHEIEAKINEIIDTVPVQEGCRVMTLYSVLFMPKAEQWYNGFKFYRVGQAGETLIGGRTVPIIEFERRY